MCHNSSSKDLAETSATPAVNNASQWIGEKVREVIYIYIIFFSNTGNRPPTVWGIAKTNVRDRNNSSYGNSTKSG